jgi:hypothetical protein
MSLDNSLWRAPRRLPDNRENAARSNRATAEPRGKIRVGTLMLPEDY